MVMVDEENVGKDEQNENTESQEEINELPKADDESQDGGEQKPDEQQKEDDKSHKMSEFEIRKMLERKLDASEKRFDGLKQELDSVRSKVDSTQTKPQISQVDEALEKISKDYETGQFSRDNFKGFAQAVSAEVVNSVKAGITPILARQQLIESEIGKMRRQSWYEPSVEPYLRETLAGVNPQDFLQNPARTADEAYSYALGKYSRSEGKSEMNKTRTSKQIPPKLESGGQSRPKSSAETIPQWVKDEADKRGLEHIDWWNIVKNRDKNKK